MVDNVEDYEDSGPAGGLMNPRLLLCDHVLRNKLAEGRAAAYKTCVDEGITSDILDDADGSAGLWRAMTRFYQASPTKGNVPSKEALLQDFPAVVADLPNSSAHNIVDLCERVKAKYYFRELNRLTEAATGKMNSPARPRLATLAADNRAAVALLTAKVSRRSSDVVTMANVDSLIEDMVASGKRPVTMPWPWKTLNLATKGIQPSQFTIITAINKTGKTTICLLLAMNLLVSGKRVGFYSKEMDADLMKKWLLCMFAGIPFDAVVQGPTDDQVLKLEAAAAAMKEGDILDRILFTTCNKADGTDGGPAEVEEFINTFHPDVMILDSFYHMVMPVGTTKITETITANLAAVTKELRQVCMRTKCPIIGNMQDLEAKAKKQNDPYSGDGTAYHTTAFQDADNGFRLVNSPDGSETTLYVVRARTFRSGFSFTFTRDQSKDYAEIEGGTQWRIGDAEAAANKEKDEARALRLAMKMSTIRERAETTTSRFNRPQTIKELEGQDGTSKEPRDTQSGERRLRQVATGVV